MAIPPPDPNFTGAQKTAYAKQYGGYWSGSKYIPTGTAPKPAPVTTTPKPAAVKPVTNTAMSGSVTVPANMTPLTPKGQLGFGTTATAPAAGGASIQSAFRDAMVKQLGQDPNAVSLQDPFVAQQSRAYQDSQQRAYERQRQALAEQGFAGGALGTGAYDLELQRMQQQQGEEEGQFNAALLGDTRNTRMAELFQALGLGGETIAQGEDSILRQNALNVQNALGQGDLNLRDKLGRGQLQLGLLQAMLGDRQAADRLGFDIGAFGATLGLNSANSILRGGK